MLGCASGERNRARNGTIVDGTGVPELAGKLQAGTGVNLKRYANHSLAATEWSGAKAEDPYWILDTVEFKTAWHPVGL